MQQRKGTATAAAHTSPPEVDRKSLHRLWGHRSPGDETLMSYSRRVIFSVNSAYSDGAGAMGRNSEDGMSVFPRQTRADGS